MVSIVLGEHWSSFCQCFLSSGHKALIHITCKWTLALTFPFWVVQGTTKKETQNEHWNWSAAFKFLLVLHLLLIPIRHMPSPPEFGFIMRSCWCYCVIKCTTMHFFSLETTFLFLTPYLKFPISGSHLIKCRDDKQNKTKEKHHRDGAIHEVQVCQGLHERDIGVFPGELCQLFVCLFVCFTYDWQFWWGLEYLDYRLLEFSYGKISYQCSLFLYSKQVFVCPKVKPTCMI